MLNAHPERRDSIITAIAVFKFIKALLLIASGIAALRLVNPPTAARVEAWFEHLPLNEERVFALRFFAKLTGSNVARMKELGVAAFAYGVLFGVEGIGLWLRRVWAEYLTIIATGSLIPFELYEVVHHDSPTKIALIALNVAVVIYLIWRVRRRREPGTRNQAPGTSGGGVSESNQPFDASAPKQRF